MSMSAGARRRLRGAYRSGTRLDLAGAAVDAELLAGLLRGGGGRLGLADARIIGRLDLTGARIEMPLVMRRCVFEQPLRLTDADLVSLNLDECTLPAVEADGIKINGDVRVRDATIAGNVWLLPARVGGTVELDRSGVGGTVHLQRAEIGGALNLRETRVARGVRLGGARVGSTVDLRAARLGADPQTGAALAASAVVVGGSLSVLDMVAGGDVHLIGAQVTGSVNVHRTVLHATGDGYALLLIEAQARLLTLRPDAASTGTISLRDARVGRFVDDPVGWPAGCRVELDGFGYERLARRSEDVVQWSVRQRLDWMARQAAGYTPGAYDQLAAALTRDGREQDARRVRVVRERRRYRAMGWAGAVWGAIQDAGIGFGYRPGRALVWLLAVVAAATGWFAWSGPLRAVKADESPTWDPFLYSVDLLVPLLDLGHDKAWDPVGTDKAVALSVMVAGWVLATTVVAGAGRTLGRGGQGA